MIDFNTLLNAAFDAAIEAKLAPLREQIKQLVAQGLDTHIMRVASDSLDLELVPDLKRLVDERVEYGVSTHTNEYDHDDFASEDDIRSKVDDVLDDMFASKFEAALDGTRVTLRT